MALEDEFTATVAASVLALFYCLADTILSHPTVDGVRFGPRHFLTGDSFQLMDCLLCMHLHSRLNCLVLGMCNRVDIDIARRVPRIFGSRTQGVLVRQSSSFDRLRNLRK